ncbi:MAG: hypothetical protein ABIH41_01145 [Nanoarchaeota archaeon]
MTDPEIIGRLDAIKAELDAIKKKMVHTDAILTDDDIASLKVAEKELKYGKSARLI